MKKYEDEFSIEHNGQTYDLKLYDGREKWGKQKGVPYCDIFEGDELQGDFRCNPTGDNSWDINLPKLEERAKQAIQKLEELPF